MKSWLIVILGCVGTWHGMDISADSIFYSIILPICFGLFVFALAVKVSWLISARGGVVELTLAIGAAAVCGLWWWR